MTAHERAGRRWRRRRARTERGYASVLVAAGLASGLFLVAAAMAVDVSKWYREMEGVQAAADAAALAGVPFLPQDLPSAVDRAKEVAKRNGYDDAASDVVVTVERGTLPSQLRVTVSQDVTNPFGSMVGVGRTTISRVATADYQGPAPMGSPCNTFGNEPNAGTGGSSATPAGSVQGSTPFTNCSRTPQFWATVEGPETGKVQGDRYQTKGCEDSGVDGCDGSRNNEEYDEFGYVFVVQVRPQAVNTDVTVQLYDPIFFEVGQRCERLPDESSFNNNSSATNPYVVNSDARNRYTNDGSTSRSFCTGDSYAGSSPRTVPTTSFVLRQQTDSQDPTVAPVQNSTSGSPCQAQYTGLNRSSSGANVSANVFKSSAGAYDVGVAKNFHNWVDLCTFRPTRSGDYYIQVRTNVTPAGSCSNYVCTGTSAVSAATGNTTTGGGTNSFAMRARTASGKETAVSVSGYNHMPIFVNSDQATVRFNLIRVLPGAAGQFISFSYFDAGDAQGSGSVRVVTPSDATGSVTTNPFPSNCRSYGGSAGGSATSPVTLTNCTAPFEKQAYSSTSKNNGKVQTIYIPIPSDYNCNFASAGGCWYQVDVAFGSGTVNDVTTWDATIVGDPVRLVR